MESKFNIFCFFLSSQELGVLLSQVRSESFCVCVCVVEGKRSRRVWVRTQDMSTASRFGWRVCILCTTDLFLEPWITRVNGTPLYWCWSCLRNPARRSQPPAITHTHSSAASGLDNLHVHIHCFSFEVFLLYIYTLKYIYTLRSISAPWHTPPPLCTSTHTAVILY